MAIYKRGNSWTVQISRYISDPSGKIRLTQDQMEKIDIELAKLFLDKL